jgi:hypothetical protein
MLEIVLMEQQQSFRFSFVGKLFQTSPVPCVRTGQIILAHSFPSRSLSATGKRLFVERSPNIPVAAADTFVVIPATVVPKSVIMVHHQRVATFHIGNHRIHPVGQPFSFHIRNETGKMVGSFRQGIVFDASTPPTNVLAITNQQTIIGYQITILYAILFLRSNRLYRFFKLHLFYRFHFLGRHRCGKRSLINPLFQSQQRFVCFFSQFHSLLYGRTTAGIRRTGQDTRSAAYIRFQPFR